MTRVSDPGTSSATVTAPQQVAQRTIPTLERQIDDACAGRPKILILNMAAVQIIDSAALMWLLSVQARLDTLGTALQLEEPSGLVTDVLLATRLDNRFTIVQSRPNGEQSGGPNVNN